MSYREWSGGEEAFLYQMWPDYTDAELSRMMDDRSPAAVRKKRERLGIRRTWSEDEVSFLEASALDYTDYELSQMPELSRHSAEAIKFKRQILHRYKKHGPRPRNPRRLASKAAEHKWAQSDFPSPLGFCPICEIEATCPHCGKIDYGEVREAVERARIDHSNLPYRKGLVLPMCVSHNSLHSFNGFVILFKEVSDGSH